MANYLNIFCDCDIPREDLDAFAQRFEQLTGCALSKAEDENPPFYEYMDDLIVLFVSSVIEEMFEPFDDFPFLIQIRAKRRQAASTAELTDGKNKRTYEIFEALKRQDKIRLALVDERDDKVLASFGAMPFDTSSNES